MYLDSLQNAENLKLIMEERKKIDPITLFMLFINIKKYYETHVFKETDKNEINSIINYGNFAYPQTVKKTLLSKYKKITMDKMYQDTR